MEVSSIGSVQDRSQLLSFRSVRLNLCRNVRVLSLAFLIPMAPAGLTLICSNPLKSVKMPRAMLTHIHISCLGALASE